MDIYTLKSGRIAELIEGRFRGAQFVKPQLEEVFRNILWAANQYVPSESGSVTLADPESEFSELVFIASFGERAEIIPGTRFHATQGISGRVYRTGKATIRNDVTKDASFYRGVDEKTQFTTRSILCVPITVDDTVCGVLSLLNRVGATGFRRRDLRLMEIFCRYISTSIQNLINYFWQRELAERDHLSGLYNDRMFYQKLLDAITVSERDNSELGLIFMDLDHFKGVVDQHGHLVGSRVLAEVGHLLARAVARPGASLARYGGDEYCIILPGADRYACLDVAEIIRLAVKDHTYLTEPMADGSPPLNIHGRFTASLGVASYRDVAHKGTLEARRHSFIRMADEAMYAAKAAGKDCVHLSQGVPAASSWP